MQWQRSPHGWGGNGVIGSNGSYALVIIVKILVCLGKSATALMPRPYLPRSFTVVSVNCGLSSRMKNLVGVEITWDSPPWRLPGPLKMAHCPKRRLNIWFDKLALIHKINSSARISERSARISSSTAPP